jgi:hypothetical protein
MITAIVIDPFTTFYFKFFKFIFAKLSKRNSDRAVFTLSSLSVAATPVRKVI